MNTKGEQQVPRMRVSSLQDNQCIWMKAGVVNYKICDNCFDCTSCDFDKAFSRKSGQRPTARVKWREVMNQPHLQKKCRHMLTGSVLFKLCSHNYECKDCPYDQFLDEYDQHPGAEDCSTPSAPWVNPVGDRPFYHCHATL